MKYLFFILLLAVSCNEASKDQPLPKPHKDMFGGSGVEAYGYPKFVYNKCSSRWAIETGVRGNSKSYFSGQVMSIKDERLGYVSFGGDERFWHEPEGDAGVIAVGDDSLLQFEVYSALGHESTFGSRDSAKSLYDRTLLVFVNQIKREKFVADSTKRANDSAFRCLHTYE